MFPVIDGVGRGQPIEKNEPNEGFGISGPQKSDDINSTTATTTNVNASVYEDEDGNFAMKKALRIHLILNKILMCLNPPHLVQARLVSPVDWFDVATDILIRRRCLRIDFAYSSKIGRYVSISDSIHDESSSSSKTEEFPELHDTLHKLTNCIRGSRKFPCVRFGLSGELNKREVREFFNVYGSQVKELDLDLVFPLYNPQLKPPFELANILLFQAPNLDGLHIKRVKNKRRNANPSLFDSSTSSPVKLPKLRTIILNERVDRNLEIIQDIITAAVANRGFKCHFDFPSEFSIEHVDLFIQLNKLDTVRNLKVSCPRGNPDEEEVENPIMELYRRFANAHHKLFIVDLDGRDYFRRGQGFREILPKIFDYNRKTLKEIVNSFYLNDWNLHPNIPYKHCYNWVVYDSEMEKGLSDGAQLIQGSGKHKPAFAQLLKKILSHLNTSQLLDCRLVNKNWSHEASSILIERKSIHLQFNYSPQADRFILSKNHEENVELPVGFFVEDLPSIRNLTSNYSNQKLSPSFPCYKMSIMTPLPFSERSTEVHLPLHFDNSEGLSELELIFDFGPHTTRAEWKFIRDLIYRTYYLKVLTLTNINNYKSPRSCTVLPMEKLKSDIDNKRLSIEMLQMNKLECRVDDSNTFTIESYQSFLDETGADSMIIIGSHLEFRPTGKNIQMCQKIAESFSQLRSINIDLSVIYEEGESDNWRKVSSILSQILKSSCQTLIEITGIDQLGFLPGLKLPQFTSIKGEKSLGNGSRGLELRNLKYSFSKDCQVDDLPDFTVSLLPRGCEFSACFPFLTSLIINYFPDGAEIDKCHPNYHYMAPNIQRLTIGQSSSPINPFIFQKISGMFPQLEFLSVAVNVEDFYGMSGSIWTKFPMLKELRILFIIRAELEKQQYFPGLDAAFTGFPQSFCKSLYEAGCSSKNFGKTYPSLTNLQKLKSLHIYFEDFSRPEDPWNYFTRVSNRGTFYELIFRNIWIEVKTCDSRNIQKIEHALRWIKFRARPKVDIK